jgi:hypothetical protein
MNEPLIVEDGWDNLRKERSRSSRGSHLAVDWRFVECAVPVMMQVAQTPEPPTGMGRF